MNQKKSVRIGGSYHPGRFTDGYRELQAERRKIEAAGTAFLKAHGYGKYGIELKARRKAEAL